MIFPFRLPLLPQRYHCLVRFSPLPAIVCAKLQIFPFLHDLVLLRFLAWEVKDWQIKRHSFVKGFESMSYLASCWNQAPFQGFLTAKIKRWLATTPTPPPTTTTATTKKISLYWIPRTWEVVIPWKFLAWRQKGAHLLTRISQLETSW